MKKILVLALILAGVAAGWGAWQLRNVRVTVDGQEVHWPSGGKWQIGQGGCDGPVSVTVNDQQLSGPMRVVVGVWGVLATGVALFFVAVLLAVVFAGVGVIVFGVMALVAVILAAVAIPFLIPFLIPLLILWVIFAGVGRVLHGNAKK